MIKVALETSVVAHGLPAPHNLEAWRRCEQAVREAGAEPATIGVLDGRVCVGMTEPEVARLAQPGAMKLGSGELAIAVASGRSGGTTVSATCELACREGIRVFATGGIGGIHRGDFDVSQDLWALSRFPVAVVCSGAKAILDLPRTIEALEALAVPVVGVGTDEFPAFYCAQSGILLAHRVEDVAAAAAVARARLAQGTGAVLFVVPPPNGLPRDEVERHIWHALDEAEKKGVRGKAVTPFLLDWIARATDGRALRANIDLLENNARFAGQLARELTA